MECPSCGQSVQGVVFWIDAEAHSICIDGQHISFTPDEFTVFAALHGKAPKLVSNDQLCFAVWNIQEPETAESTIKVHISRIRKMLGDTRLGIENIWGEGYRLITEAA